MGRQDDVVSAKQPGILGERLGRHHIERGAAETAIIERGDQRGLVDQRSARRVDQVGAALHLAESRGVEQAAGCRHQRRVNRYEIGLRQELVEADAFDAGVAQCVGRHERIERQHPQAKRLSLRGDPARDVAEPDEAEHLALEPPDRHDGRHLPAAGLHEVVREHDLAGEREQERHCGDFLHAIVRHVRHGDAALGRDRDIDIVDAEPKAADRTASRELAQQLARQLGVGDEDRVGVARHRQDVVGRRAFRHAQLGIETLERCDRRIERREHAVGDGDQGFGHGKLRVDVE